MRKTTPKTELTPEEFSSFLKLLSPDRDRAGEEYQSLCFRLCTFLSMRRCPVADELADETIDRVIRKASEERIENVVAYSYAVARNVYLEWSRKQRKPVDTHEVQVAETLPEKPSLRRECFDKCLEQLSPETRSILLDYFSESKSAKIKLHREISQTLGITQNALRMRVKRAKDDLKTCIKQCMSLEAVT